MRFFPQSSNACSVAVALLMMASAVQAQGLKTPAAGKAKGAESSVSRALDATVQSSGRQLPAAGPRAADYIVAVVNSEPITNNDVRARMARVPRT